MKLFVKSAGCPACEGLKRQMDLNACGADVYDLGDRDHATSETEAAWAEHDLEDVMTVPTLVLASGEHVTDPFRIAEILEGETR